MKKTTLACNGLYCHVSAAVRTCGSWRSVERQTRTIMMRNGGIRGFWVRTWQHGDVTHQYHLRIRLSASFSASDVSLNLHFDAILHPPVIRKTCNVASYHAFTLPLIDWAFASRGRVPVSSTASCVGRAILWFFFFSPRFPLSCWLIAVEVFFLKSDFSLKGFI